MQPQAPGAAGVSALAPLSGVGRTGGFLGWFSLGLGLAQLLAPGALTRLIGARDDERNRTLVRAMGLREIVVGVGFLTQGHARWSWARLLGDALDLALLGKAAGGPSAKTGRLVATSAAVVGAAWLDARRARSLERERSGVSPRKLDLSAVVTINSSRDDVYAFWRDFENLPRFVSHLEAVRAQNGHSRWWARAPAGIELKWDAEIILDRPGEVIAWQSVHGAELPNRGVVRFKDAPGGRGTEVHLTMTFEPRGGRPATAVSRLLAKVSEQRLNDDLRRLKQLLETGDVVRSDTSIHRGPHPARPSRGAR